MEREKTILLVEDDKDDQFFFKNAMGDIEGAALKYVANNGQEALNMLTEFEIKPDLIFMDINMPILNGLDCLAELSKSPGLKEIPVVIISTSDANADLAFKLGAKAFVTKPSSEASLRKKIKQVLQLEFIVGAREPGPAANPSNRNLRF